MPKPSRLMFVVLIVCLGPSCKNKEGTAEMWDACLDQENFERELSPAEQCMPGLECTGICVLECEDSSSCPTVDDAPVMCIGGLCQFTCDHNVSWECVNTGGAPLHCAHTSTDDATPDWCVP